MFLPLLPLAPCCVSHSTASQEPWVGGSALQQGLLPTFCPVLLTCRPHSLTQSDQGWLPGCVPSAQKGSAWAAVFCGRHLETSHNLSLEMCFVSESDGNMRCARGPGALVPPCSPPVATLDGLSAAHPSTSSIQRPEHGLKWN